MRMLWRRTWFFLCAVAALGLVTGDVRSRASTSERQLHVGRDALRREAWDVAERWADRLIIAEQRDHGRLLRGELLHKQKKFASAVEALNRVRAEGDLRVQAALVQGLCFLELENPRAADAAFRYVLAQRPNDIDALRGAASVAYDQGMWYHAEEHLRKLVDLLPNDGRPLWTLGIIHRDLSLFPDAEKFLRDALQRPLPGSVPDAVRADLAFVLAAQKKYDEALAVTEQIPVDDRTAAVWQSRADCLRSLNRLTEAYDDVRQGVERFRHHPELVAEYGLIQLDRGVLPDAIFVLEQSLQRDPHMVRARQGLMRAYQRAGRSDDAVAQQAKIMESEGYFKQLTDLTDAAMNKPWDANVRRQLAEVCQKLNKVELARVWQQAAAACEPR